MESTTPSKRCTGCGDEKPYSSFYFAAGKPISKCKICTNESDRIAYREGRRKPSRHKPASELSPEALARRREKQARYNSKRKDYQKMYRESNKDSASDYSKEYRAKNQERVNTYKRNYKARKKLALGKHSGEDVLAKLAQQSGNCYWCREELKTSGSDKYQVDHIIALAIGGSNGPENICCACPKCNHGKRDRLPYQFCGRLL